MKLEVTFEVELPDVEHTREQLIDYLQFELGGYGRLSGDNPFRGESCDAKGGSVEYDYLIIDYSKIKTPTP